ncbi:hypothetical protein ACF0H5_000975 [Mactra antiquata]
MTAMSESIQFIKFVHDTNIDNKISTNAENIIQTDKTKNMEDCAYMCYSNATCMAYFFTYRTSDCQLMNKDINYDTELSSRDGTHYFYKRMNLRRISAFTAPTKTPTSHIMKSTTSSTTSRSPTTTSSTPSKTSTSPTTTSTISSTTSTARTTSSTTRTTRSAVPISCQDLSEDWVELHYPDGSINHYRLYDDIPRKQSVAKNLCEKENAKLPVILTTEKQDAFIQLILKPCEKFANFWADGDNLENHNNYITWNKTVIIENTELWSKARPNHRENQNCIQMASKFLFRFDDVGCYDDEIYTICEK